MSDRTRDYFDDVDELRADGIGWDAAEVRVVQGRRVVPFRCHDCGRPAYYDHGDDLYHHADDPARGCFLIPADTRDPDPRHPDLFAWEPKPGDRFRLAEEGWRWHAGDVTGVHETVLVCEVDHVDEHRIGYRAVEVVSETGRPPFVTDALGSGGIARFALRDYAATGVIEVLP